MSDTIMVDETLNARESPVDETGYRSVWMWSLICLIAGIGALLFVFRESAAAMLAVWRASPSFEHGFLIVLLALIVALARHRSLRRIAPRPWYRGLIFAVPASGIAILGEAASVMVVQQFALVALIQVLVLSSLGPEVFRRLLFPLVYLYFAVPVGDVIVPALQDLTAQSTVRFLSAFGVTATVDGFLIRLPKADFRVAEACAGLRFFLVGFATSLLMANLFLRSWSRRVLFLVIAIVVPLIGNTLRAASLIVFAEEGILEADSMAGHLTYGLGFTGLLLLVLFGLAFLMRDEPSPRPELAGDVERVPTGAPSTPLHAYALVTVLVVAIPTLAYAYIERTGPPSSPKLTLRPPAIAANWQTPSTRGDNRWLPSVPTADATLRRNYAKDGRSVDLYIAAFAWQRQGAEVVSGQNQFAAPGGWREISRARAVTRVDGGQIGVTSVAVQSKGQQRLVWALYWVGATLTGNPVLAKLYQARSRLLGGDPRAALIVASTRYSDSPNAAEQTLSEFFADLDAASAFSAKVASTK